MAENKKVELSRELVNAKVDEICARVRTELIRQMEIARWGTCVRHAALRVLLESRVAVTDGQPPLLWSVRE